ncbi:LCP family protein [Amycolatopsis sp. K13G38]|uniref:LCP family protein n=1 Tax=Amycolatopsis acididurans TaxID=2724524 RepID=A0ABX1J2A5_9PSEU|nr:LCP family protein [Amycolatopsis acididurans]NKQ53913.1 LCP family protein [Amycolatopsis acididurans]
MTQEQTERLIRQALAAEADRAVDPRVVLAELERRRARPPRRRTPLVLSAAAVAVAVLVATLVVPRLLRDDQPPAGATAVTDQNILLVGVDDANHADSIALTHLGADGSAAVISVPRDTLTDVPGLGPRTLGTTLPEGPERLVSAVQSLTGVHIDHYVLVGMAAFERISTEVGGVPVCLVEASPPFASGIQVLSGPRTLDYLRQRLGLPKGDLDRIARLQTFLRSLAGRLAAQGKIADQHLLTTVRDNVRTDPGWNLLDVAALLRGLHVADLRTGTIPLVDAHGSTPGVLLAAPAEVQAYVRGMLDPATAAVTSRPNRITTTKAGAPPVTSSGAPQDGPVRCVN